MASTQDIVNTTLGGAAILAGVGYALGQFFSSRKKGTSDSLATALDEIAIQKERSQRLAEVATLKTAELSEKQQEIAILKNLISTGSEKNLSDALEAAVSDCMKTMHTEHEKTRELIELLRSGR